MAAPNRYRQEQLRVGAAEQFQIWTQGVDEAASSRWSTVIMFELRTMARRSDRERDGGRELGNI